MTTPMERIGHLRTLKRNSILLYTAEFLPRLGALFIVPVWSAVIAPAEYARWILSLTSIEFMAAVGSLGLVSYMVKVLYRYHDERANQYFGMAMVITMSCTALFAIAMAIFSPWLSHVMVESHVRSDLFIWLGIYLMGTQFNNLVIIYIQSRIDYGASFVLVLSRWATNMVFLLYFLLIRHQGFYSWVWASLISEIAVLPLSLYNLRHVVWGYFNLRMMKFAFRFSLPTMATNFLGWGQSRVGRYVLSFGGLQTGLGLYGVAQNFSQNYGAMVRPVKVVAAKMLGHTLEQDADSPYFLEFFHGFSCIGLSLAFLAALFFRDIMKLLISPTYWEARAALPALIFGLFMEEMFDLYHTLMFRYFKVWFDFWRTFIAFPIVTVATIAFVHWFGFVGAALAQFVGAGTMWIYAHRYAKRITNRPFLLRTKIIFTLLAFCLSELAYILHFSFSLRIAMAFIALGPYFVYYWRRRDKLFPRLSIRLGLLDSGPANVLVQEQ